MKRIPDALLGAVIAYLFLASGACSGGARLTIIDRHAWGSEPVIAAPVEHRIQYITVHHGGVFTAPETDPAGYLQKLQAWSRTEKQWIDIPYHYLIDLEGRVYEGRPVRFPGDTNTGYDPQGHLLICVIGNYEEQPFSTAQYDVLVSLLVYSCETFGVDPALIKGHKDYTETACPGRNIYRYLENGALVADVSKNLRERRK